MKLDITTTQDQSQQTAYQEGAMSCDLGLSIWNNPYAKSFDTKNYYDWKEGYNDTIRSNNNFGVIYA